MRAKKVILSILIVLFLASIPIAAYALRVTANGVEIGSSTATVDVGGVLTTTVDFSGGVTVGGFTISGTAIAEQSGSEERILFQNMSITGAGFMSITATSDPTDFAPKEPGGYPGAVIIVASIAGAPGNQISATGDTNFDTINGYPGGSEVSVPWICAGSGSGNCQFTTIGDPFADVFFDVGFENTQLACGEALCTPSQSFTINMMFVGSTLNVPAAGTVESKTHSAGDLIGTVPPLIGTSLKLSQTKVEIEVDDKEFELKTSFTVNGDGIIDPLSEDVSFSVGPFLATIPADSFRLRRNGRFTFEGVINGVELEAQIVPLGSKTFEFKAEGEGANLTDIKKPVAVGLKIGDKSGYTLDTKVEFE